MNSPPLTDLSDRAREIFRIEAVVEPQAPLHQIQHTRLVVVQKPRVGLDAPLSQKPRVLGR